MLRRTVSWLARPKGPLGQTPGRKFELSMPYRSEAVMVRHAKGSFFNSSIRERYKMPLFMSGLRAIPRDLGEIPRNYALKLLFLHQPIRLLDLWEICKQRDDVPFDSAKHLRNVLKIAARMKWVYAEKNQTNNLWYYYIHQSRSAEVQELIRQATIVEKDEERQADVRAAQQAEEMRAQRSEALDESIMALQNMLVHNVATIAEFDPEYTRTLPFVTESGAVDVAWALGDAVHAQREETAEGTS